MGTVTKSIDLPGDPEGDASSAHAGSPPVTRAGPFVVDGALGAGGGGSVWLARDVRSEPPRPVAIKFLHAEAARDPVFRRRFLREAEIASGIHHPNVTPVEAVGEIEGHPYLVMPFVDGTNLRELLRLGALPLAVVVTVGFDALSGLAAAHDARGADGTPLGLVHRDISPHNFLVSRDGTTSLTDFGIARPAALGGGVSTTRWAQGKVSYFSPEQGRGEALDQRSDLFAMGIVLWECLVGRSLYRADDPFVTAHRVQTMKVTSPSDERPEVPAELAAVVLRALALSRDDRFATAEAMLDALRAAMTNPSLAYDRGAVAEAVARVRGPATPLPMRAAFASATDVDATAGARWDDVDRAPLEATPGVTTKAKRSRWLIAASALIGVAGVASAMVRPSPSKAGARTETVSPSSVAEAHGTTEAPKATASTNEEAPTSAPTVSAIPTPPPKAPAPRRSTRPAGNPSSPTAKSEPRLPSPQNPF